MEAMRGVQQSFQQYEQLLFGHRKIELLYERLFNGATLSADAWAKLVELLEIEPADTSSELVKMNPNNLRPMVENYDELAAALAGTEFERYLD